MKLASAPQHDLRQLDTAMQWVLRLRDDAVTEQEIAEWLSWYESDEANKRAFDELQGLWHATGALAAGPGGAARMRRLARVDGSHAGRRRWLPAAVAAALALLAVALPWLHRAPETAPSRVAPVAGAPGPIVRTTPLPDGSRVELSARTEVAVQYSERERLLEMRDGEAFFTVAPNRDRPFVVKVGDVRVKAVGTAFNIRHTGDRTAVAVTEGVVEVSKGLVAPVQVAAGNILILAGAATPRHAAPVDPARALAWREGRLEYINEPLAAVIADVNRYTDRPVTVDAAAAQLTFTGTVFVASVEDWLQALPRQFPVELVTTRDERHLVADPER